MHILIGRIIKIKKTKTKQKEKRISHRYLEMDDDKETKVHVIRIIYLLYGYNTPSTENRLLAVNK